ncbi:MAG: hypothetical protein KGY49_13195 [Wenzhouxiangellaceae bacterium]|nr:hypothetical protein [Wenzhouxiangellaceae bacterium]
MLTAILGGLAQPAYPETGNACVDASAKLRHHLAANGAAERLEVLRGFMQKTIEESGHTPLDLVGELFAEPPAIAEVPAETRSLLPAARPLESKLLLESPLDAIHERLDRIHGQLDTALAGVTDEQAGRLRRLLPALLERTSNGSDLEDIENGRVLVEIQAAIDQSALEETTALLAGLAQPEVAASLAEHFRDEPADTTPAWLEGHVAGDIIRAIQTEHGAVIVGGPGTNIYTGPAALIIDTGGDDVYVLPGGDPVRVIIDLEGNDSYNDQADGALAGSVLGASLVADHAGDDVHAGGRITQGAAVAGIGMLHDHAGNDRYFAAELAQGASLAGIGILVDHGGDDLYTAAKFAQGYGGALGIGVLSDHAGNDTYLAGNKHPSSYGVAGNHQAFSQGVGMGFRNDVAGGIGVLRDRNGDDRYIAGNYSQGTGYYLGAGLLLDQDGNDTYAGGRYTQGAAAHLGVGLLRDAAGDDNYIGSTSASQGGAWDLAIAALLDCAGDDGYTTNEFGLGAAAQNAIAFFVDGAGKDEFTATRNAQGHSGPVDYHDGGKRIGNLAVFISGKQVRVNASGNGPDCIPEP